MTLTILHSVLENDVRLGARPATRKTYEICIKPPLSDPPYLTTRESIIDSITQGALTTLDAP